MSKGVFLGLASFAAYAISDAFVKASHGSLPTYETVFFSGLLGLSLLPFMKEKDDHWRDALRSPLPVLWCVRALSAALTILFSVISFTLLPMAKVFSMIFLMPIFATMLSVFVLHEHVTKNYWIAVMMGLSGVLVILRPGVIPVGIGELAAILCGLCSAITIITLRMSKGREKNISLYGSSVIGTLLLGLSFMLPNFVWPNLNQFGLLIGYGMFAAFARIILMYATKFAPANHVAITQYSQMLWGIGLGYIFFNDALSLPMLLGSLIILGAGIFAFRHESGV